MTESSSHRSPSQFVLRLRPLTVRDYELLSPAACERREAWRDAQCRNAPKPPARRSMNLDDSWPSCGPRIASVSRDMGLKHNQGAT